MKKRTRDLMMRPALLAVPVLIAAGCNASDTGAAGNVANAAVAEAPPPAPPPAPKRPFTATEVARFDQPWAMTFIPGTGEALITEKEGRLLLWHAGAPATPVAGVPKVDYGGQGGLGDVILHPEFATNHLVYLSWVEAGEGDTRGAVVGRARLVTDGGEPRLEDMEVIWRQDPKVAGRGHYGHRLAFSPDGYLFITSGERQKFDPAQNMNMNLGKVIRLTDTGEVPPDNPFAGRGPITSQIWTLGHRNPLGLAFDADGRLWEHEMGPEGGDEFNLIEKGKNYGYPIVSNGDHYDGRPIPDHDTRPEFAAPKISWNPVISPAGLIIYSGGMFPEWSGDAFLGALSGQSLVRIDLDGDKARVGDRWDMGQRIREVEQGPDGAIFVLEDAREGSGGRLLKLTPAR